MATNCRIITDMRKTRYRASPMIAKGNAQVAFQRLNSGASGWLVLIR
jgi:hypothetical protein